MPGFSNSIPTNLFIGEEIEYIIIGASSLKFQLSNDKSIMLYYYGALDDKDDWLYNLCLCGADSVQSLVGQFIVKLNFKKENEAEISFSGGRVLMIKHDDIRTDLMSFRVGEEDYIA